MTPSADFKLTVANRADVRLWLVEQGVLADRVNAMRDSTLERAFTKPAYLRAMLSRGDYVGEKPCGERMNQSVTVASAAIPTKDNVVLTPAAISTSRPSSKPGEPSASELTMQPKPSEPASVPFNGECLLTEARVIELIKEHAPRILIDRLLLGEF